MKALGVDAYASSSHKWMLAPKGSGLLYIRKEVQDRIQPLVLSTGYQAYTCRLGHARRLPDPGPRACHGLPQRHRPRSRRGPMPGAFELPPPETAGESRRLKLLTPTHDELSSGMVTFSLLRGKNDQVYERLHADHDILVKVVPKAEYNALRFSTHVFNREEELDRTADAIASILRLEAVTGRVAQGRARLRFSGRTPRFLPCAQAPGSVDSQA